MSKRYLNISICHVLLLAPLLWLPAAHGWGPDGHRIVAELAERRLSEQVQLQVRALMQDSGSDTLADIANWADEVRREEAYRWSARYHFLNFPRGHCHYDAGRDCPNGVCIVGGIQRFAEELADPSLPQAQRFEALKWLVHFVGDLHQPLHAGFADDRGGNDFQINYQRRGSNLHAAWDSLLIRSRELDWQSYVDELDENPGTAEPRQAEQAVAWAEESCRLIETAEIYPPRPGRLNRPYVDRQRPVAERQLVLAGERLAGLLNALLIEPKQATISGPNQ